MIQRRKRKKRKAITGRIQEGIQVLYSQKGVSYVARSFLKLPFSVEDCHLLYLDIFVKSELKVSKMKTEI